VSLRKADQIVILLGAGASYKAGIPVSNDMINSLEQLLCEDRAWGNYRELYHFVKSAIYFADGIGGKFNNAVNYNIERLVNTLSELERKASHPLYPFIGNWNIKLMELGGTEFDEIVALKKGILGELQNNWVLLSDYSQSCYYRGLFDFRKDYEYPLRIFSLNYDLCVEKNCKTERIERGFGDTRIWDWKNFDYPEGYQPDIFLYKLHGSIDWLRDAKKRVTFSDEPAKIRSDQLEIIFGTDYKLQYIDPFLFFVYQFRQWTLEAKLIVAVGYGFGDPHINGILGQALNIASDSTQRKLLAVAPFPNEAHEEAQKRVAHALGVYTWEQIVIVKECAENFMQTNLTIDKLNKLFPEGRDTFSEVS
jgi:hypothetical protein